MKGFEPALLNVGGGKQVSTFFACAFFSPLHFLFGIRSWQQKLETMHALWLTTWACRSDLATHPSHFPPTFTVNSHSGQLENWLPVGLNERLRILCYDSGQVEHSLVSQPKNCKNNLTNTFCMSLIEVSVSLWWLLCASKIHTSWRWDEFCDSADLLNGGLKGAATRFLTNKEDEDVDVVPAPGKVLVFQHDILHEESLVIKGRKYAIRTTDFLSFDVHDKKTKKEQHSNLSPSFFFLLFLLQTLTDVVMHTDKGPRNEYSVRPVVLTEYDSSRRTLFVCVLFIFAMFFFKNNRKDETKLEKRQKLWQCKPLVLIKNPIILSTTLPFQFSHKFWQHCHTSTAFEMSHVFGRCSLFLYRLRKKQMTHFPLISRLLIQLSSHLPTFDPTFLSSPDFWSNFPLISRLLIQLSSHLQTFDPTFLSSPDFWSNFCCENAKNRIVSFFCSNPKTSKKRKKKKTQTIVRLNFTHTHTHLSSPTKMFFFCGGFFIFFWIIQLKDTKDSIGRQEKGHWVCCLGFSANNQRGVERWEDDKDLGLLDEVLWSLLFQLVCYSSRCTAACDSSSPTTSQFCCFVVLLFCCFVVLLFVLFLFCLLVELFCFCFVCLLSCFAFVLLFVFVFCCLFLWFLFVTTSHSENKQTPKKTKQKHKKKQKTHTKETKTKVWFTTIPNEKMSTFSE